MSAERSFSELVQDIAGNVQDMVRSEVRLAKVELKNEAVKAAGAGKMLAIGAVVALYAGGFILLGIVLALSLTMATWLAALVVGAGAALIAAIMIQTGSHRLKQVHKPERTVATVKENVAWMRRQAR
jgi:uncharacterized membrane protein YqjE